MTNFVFYFIERNSFLLLLFQMDVIFLQLYFLIINILQVNVLLDVIVCLGLRVDLPHSIRRLFLFRLILLFFLLLVSLVDHEVIDHDLRLGKGALKSELTIGSLYLQMTLLIPWLILLDILLWPVLELIEEMLIKILRENEKHHGVILILLVVLLTHLMLGYVGEMFLLLSFLGQLLSRIHFIVLGEEEVLCIFISNVIIVGDFGVGRFGDMTQVGFFDF